MLESLWKQPMDSCRVSQGLSNAKSISTVIQLVFELWSKNNLFCWLTNFCLKLFEYNIRINIHHPEPFPTIGQAFPCSKNFLSYDLSSKWWLPKENVINSWLENFTFFFLTLKLEKFQCTQLFWYCWIADILSFHLIPKNPYNTYYYYTF